MANSEESEIQTVLERHVQSYLAANLSNSLGEELTLVGVEAPLAIGRIDILAHDVRKNLVVIELKSGMASRDALAQLQSYMGELELKNPDTFVRGILVAASLDERAMAALRIARDIRFVAYQIGFSFKLGASSPKTYDAWLNREEKQVEAPRAVAWRYCSHCRSAKLTEEQTSQRKYEYRCTHCGTVTVFSK